MNALNKNPREKRSIASVGQSGAKPVTRANGSGRFAPKAFAKDKNCFLFFVVARGPHPSTLRPLRSGNSEDATLNALPMLAKKLLVIWSRWKRMKSFCEAHKRRLGQCANEITFIVRGFTDLKVRTRASRPSKVGPAIKTSRYQSRYCLQNLDPLLPLVLKPLPCPR